MSQGELVVSSFRSWRENNIFTALTERPSLQFGIKEGYGVGLCLFASEPSGKQDRAYESSRENKTSKKKKEKKKRTPSGLPTAPTLADTPSPCGSAPRLPADASGFCCFVFAFSMETSCGPKSGFSETAENKVLKMS